MIEVVQIMWKKCGHIGHVPVETWGKVNYRCSQCKNNGDTSTEIRRMFAQCAECKSPKLTLIEEKEQDHFYCGGCNKKVMAEPRIPDFKTEVEI